MTVEKKSSRGNPYMCMYQCLQLATTDITFNTRNTVQRWYNATNYTMVCRPSNLIAHISAITCHILWASSWSSCYAAVRFSCWPGLSSCGLWHYWSDYPTSHFHHLKPTVNPVLSPVTAEEGRFLTVAGGWILFIFCPPLPDPLAPQQLRPDKVSPQVRW